MSLTQVKTTIRQYVITGLLLIVLLVSSSMQLGSVVHVKTHTGPHLQTLSHGKDGHEVFGFAPYWTMDKMQGVDFNVLTTLAYFGVPVQADGTFATNDVGYQTFESDKATQLFTKAHSFGTRVVLTLTSMDNSTIESIMNDQAAQDRTVAQAVQIVKDRGIDGINVDFEYVGDPGQVYRDKFSSFINHLTIAMHAAVPSSQVTVSVYASAIKDPKIYDISALGKSTDGIFMMAYDFATVGADNAMPTAPLYGYKDGTYWYDVSTAVSDFLTQMPANKLILGVPWYAYNYVVSNPGVKAVTLPSYSWRGSPVTQTYSVATTQVTPSANGYQTGWDNEGKVSWKAYYVASTGAWRIVFLDDVQSLGLKYDFAKDKHLLGVGMWALGFEDGQQDMWNLLENKFGAKIADNSVLNKPID